MTVIPERRKTSEAFSMIAPVYWWKKVFKIQSRKGEPKRNLQVPLPSAYRVQNLGRTGSGPSLG